MAAIHPATRYPSTRYAESLRIGAPRLLADIVGVSSIAFDLDPAPRAFNGTPTAYQDFGGVTSATAHNQGVGMLLDTKDTSRWGELVPTVALNALTWSGAELSRWTFTASTAAWANSGVASGVWGSPWYPNSSMFPIELSYDVSGFSGSSAGGVDLYSLRTYPDSPTVINTRVATANGTYTFRGYWRYASGSPTSPAYMHLYGAATNNFTLSNITAKRIDGNHGTQTVSSARPILQLDTRGWALKFDLIDDSLNVYSVNPVGAGCTLYVAGNNTITRADNVTINNTYNISAYPYIRRAIALNRAPTAREDSEIRRYLAALYGVA